MCTVINRIIGTVYEPWLSSNTTNVIKKNGISALAKKGISTSNSTCNILWHNDSCTSRINDQLIYLISKTQAACKQLEHPLYPKSHHKQFPIHHSHRSPHVLPTDYYHQLAWCYHWSMLYVRTKGIMSYMICEHGNDCDNWDLLLDNMQVTPASSLWTQLWIPKPLSGQSTSWSSVPAQFTLSSQICPLPWPKKARERATAPACIWEKE